LKATDFDRNSCILGRRTVPYSKLQRHYVCNDCGGRILIRYDDGYYACCGVCGGQDFVSESTFTRQIVEAWEVKRGLPAHLRALLDEDESVTATEAIADLYG
jgi:hypothetical protein